MVELCGCEEENIKRKKEDGQVSMKNKVTIQKCFRKNKT